MLWSLLKIILFVALVAALTVGAGILMETGPGVRLAVGDIELVLGPLQAVLLALALLVAIWIVLKLAGLLVAILRFVTGDETALSRYLDRNRERRGYQALADGMTALAMGEGKAALAYANKAERALSRPELTSLLAAQAAEQMGDTRRATEIYKRMLKDERSAFVGVRGLMRQKLAEGDTETALKLAEKAFSLRPSHGDTQDTLLRLQAGAGNWAGARRTLAAKLRHGGLPRDVFRRRDAVLAIGQARACEAAGDATAAGATAIEANKLSPDLVPGAVMAARALAAQGNQRAANRVIKRAWEAAPHPDLAAAFAALAPDESPAERLKRFGALAAMHQASSEARMMMAELHIAAEDFPAARKALGDLAEAQPTTRALTLMAAIERGQGADESVVRGWLARALSAPRGKQWVCASCGTVHAAWAPVCGQCGSLDTLGWADAPSDAQGGSEAGDMLPLLVSPARAGVEDAEPADGPANAPANAPAGAAPGDTPTARPA